MTAYKHSLRWCMVHVWGRYIQDFPSCGSLCWSWDRKAVRPSAYRTDSNRKVCDRHGGGDEGRGEGRSFGGAGAAVPHCNTYVTRMWHVCNTWHYIANYCNIWYVLNLIAINLRKVMCQESVEDAKKFGNETQLLAKVVQKLAVIRALATDLGHKRFLSKCVGWCCQMRIAYSQLLDISQLFLNFSVRWDHYEQACPGCTDAPELSRRWSCCDLWLPGHHTGGCNLLRAVPGQWCSVSRTELAAPPKGLLNMLNRLAEHCGPSQCYLWNFMDLL